MHLSRGILVSPTNSILDLLIYGGIRIKTEIHYPKIETRKKINQISVTMGQEAAFQFVISFFEKTNEWIL